MSRAAAGMILRGRPGRLRDVIETEQESDGGCKECPVPRGCSAEARNHEDPDLATRCFPAILKTHENVKGTFRRKPK